MNTVKQKKLEQIAKQIERCKLCRIDKVGLPVPGEGAADAKVIFVGEAPGKTEAETGRPFIGRSGKLLRQHIVTAGLHESKVFITSAVKYLPKHVTPTEKEISHGRVHLFSQIEVIRPKIIVLLGRVAALAVLGKNISIAKDHGSLVTQDNKTYLLAYHPAAPLYSPKLRSELEKDFKKLKRLLKTL